MKYFTVNNVRTDQLQDTLDSYTKRGWSPVHIVSIAGTVGSTFTIVFAKSSL